MLARRNVLLIFYVSMLLSNGKSIYAQSTRFSIYVDPLVSWLKPDQDVEGHGIVPAFKVGLGIDHYFGKNYAFTSDLMIEHAGGRLSFPDSVIIKTSGLNDTLPKGTILKYKLQYFSIPLGLKFTTDEIGYLTFYAQLGINPMVRTKATAKTDYLPLDKDNISKEVGLFNVGYYLGLGAYYSLGGNTSLVFGIQYFSGLVDITPSKKDQVNLQHLGLQLGILF
jgi:hypothetical protein